MADLTKGDTQLIISVAKNADLLRNQLAYCLATSYWETARTMKPVKEAYWLSESWRKNNLRYYPWYGRGYVQLTWEDNYARATRELSVDLLSDPDKAMDPEVASRTLCIGMNEGWYTGKALSDYITLDRSDFFNARDIVNGDKWKIPKGETKSIGEIIQNYAKAYDQELLKIGYGVESSQEPVESNPLEDKVRDLEQENARLWASIADIEGIIGELKNG